MPQAFPSCVLSFSSEDPNHPASNLLNRDTYRKWKCREAGEKDAYVILKFEKAVTFTAIDIGNESSSMVEVLVGRSGNADIKFEVLLSASVLMSPVECRNLTTPCGVRTYSASSFDRETAAQKWDVVKIVVSQIFNKQIQFGLSFVKFTVVGDANAPQKIGAFALRKPLGGLMDEDEDDSQHSRIGAMFAKSIANKTSNKGPTSDVTAEERSTSAAIREVTKAISGAAQLSSEGKVKEILKQGKLESGSPGSSSIKKQSYDPSQQGGSPSGRRNTNGQSDKLPSRNTLELVDSPLIERKKSNQNPNVLVQGSPKSFQSTPNNSPSSGPIKTKVDNQGRNGQLSSLSNGTKTDDSLGTGNNLLRRENKDSGSGESGLGLDRRADVNNRNSASSSSNTSSTNTTSTTHKQTPKKPKKSFGKLFEGVIFVMSGFQNPYRKEVRDKAVEMGARYKGDWDGTCTHLLCAFVNTPKFREVRDSGRGQIVKKEWIERSYDAKCRFPWRRFCLDRNDRGEESEEEIYALDEEEGEEEEILERPLGPSNDSYGNRADDRQDDVMEVDGRVETNGQAGEEEESSPRRKSRKRVLVLDSSDEEEYLAAYEADTDIDDDDDPPNTSLSSAVTKKSESGVDSAVEKDDVTTRRNNYDEDEGGDFFENLIFFLSLPKGDPLNQRSRIEQIISKRKGRIESELCEDVEYFITADLNKWTEEFSEALSDNPNLSFVRCNWILECEKSQKLTSCDPFMITPS